MTDLAWSDRVFRVVGCEYEIQQSTNQAAVSFPFEPQTRCPKPQGFSTSSSSMVSVRIQKNNPGRIVLEEVSNPV